VKLTRFERWMIVSQLKVLEATDPDGAKTYAKLAGGVSANYEFCNGEAMDLFTNPGSEGLTDEECRETFDILSMFRALDRSKATQFLPADEHFRVAFEGFDANNDSQFGFCKYLLEEDGRFQELLKGGQNPNSHNAASLDTYRRQLRVYRGFNSPVELNADQVRAIAAEFVHPSQRGPKPVTN
jgi:uncharacterized protein YfbU (UPF0304 family)